MSAETPPQNLVGRPPKVVTVLLNWNGYDVSRRCIHSLEASTYPHHEIVLIDNASGDGSGEKLRGEFPHLTYVQNQQNVGFARGCNVGIRAALERGADYVLLLNNDTVVEAGFLEPLVDTAEADPSIGLISGKVLSTRFRDKIWYAGGDVSRFTGSIHIRGFNETDHGQFDRTEDVGGCTGAMMFVPRRVLNDVGLLPEEYFFGQEEWDYSLTVRQKGFRLVFCPKSVVYHEADGSHRNLAPKFIYCGHRNRLIFQAKFLPKGCFGLWTLVYSTYVRHIAPRRLRLNRYDLQAFQAAYEAALRDHRNAKNGRVEEEDLLRFERDFESVHGVPTEFT